MGNGKLKQLFSKLRPCGWNFCFKGLIQMHNKGSYYTFLIEYHAKITTDINKIVTNSS